MILLTALVQLVIELLKMHPDHRAAVVEQMNATTDNFRKTRDTTDLGKLAPPATTRW